LPLTRDITSSLTAPPRYSQPTRLTILTTDSGLSELFPQVNGATGPLSYRNFGFTDTASGKDVARPQLDALLGFVRGGDTVVVHSMDRLARNLDDLRRLVRALTGKGVRVQFVTESLVFTGEDNAMATLLLSVIGAFAEFERALLRERQREGIAQARLRGVYRGRKRSLTTPQVAELRRRAAAGESKTLLAKEFRISRETVYRIFGRTQSPADRHSGVESQFVPTERP